MKSTPIFKENLIQIYKLEKEGLLYYLYKIFFSSSYSWSLIPSSWGWAGPNDAILTAVTKKWRVGLKQIVHKRHCSFFLTLSVGLLVLGETSYLSWEHSSLWRYLCGETRRPPPNSMWVGHLGSGFCSPCWHPDWNLMRNPENPPG